jgi:hypothetical protein
VLSMKFMALSVYDFIVVLVYFRFRDISMLLLFDFVILFEFILFKKKILSLCAIETKEKRKMNGTIEIMP